MRGITGNFWFCVEAGRRSQSEADGEEMKFRADVHVPRFRQNLMLVTRRAEERSPSDLAAVGLREHGETRIIYLRCSKRPTNVIRFSQIGIMESNDGNVPD